LLCRNGLSSPVIPIEAAFEAASNRFAGASEAMTVRDNPLKRIMVVRRIGGRLAIDVQGSVLESIKLKLRPVPARKPGDGTDKENR